MKKEDQNGSRIETQGKEEALRFPLMEYDNLTERERKQIQGEFLETLYPFLKEFVKLH